MLDFWERMGAGIETDAKATCPAGTGRLRDSTEHEVDGGTMRIDHGNDVSYAGYVEQGTRYIAATPLLRPSLFGVRSL